jgi:hypothetical protein
MEVKHRCNQVLALGFPLGGIAKLFAQDWEGDVTVVVPATVGQVHPISEKIRSKFYFCFLLFEIHYNLTRKWPSKAIIKDLYRYLSFSSFFLL